MKERIEKEVGRTISKTENEEIKKKIDKEKSHSPSYRTEKN